MIAYLRVSASKNIPKDALDALIADLNAVVPTKLEGEPLREALVPPDVSILQFFIPPDVVPGPRDLIAGFTVVAIIETIRLAVRKFRRRVPNTVVRSDVKVTVSSTGSTILVGVRAKGRDAEETVAVAVENAERIATVIDKAEPKIRGADATLNTDGSITVMWQDLRPDGSVISRRRTLRPKTQRRPKRRVEHKIRRK